MNLKSFLKVVEIQTKIASVTPFLLGIAYTLYTFGQIKALPVLFFFLSMLAFDMFTTALNNYMDWKRAQVKSGYNYETHNAIVRDRLSEKTILITLAVLFLFAAAFGLLTFLNTDLTVLALGGLSFMIGILYSAGPLPISRTPLGEIFSGFFMGMVIPFLVVYLSIYDRRPIGITLDTANIVLTLNWRLLLPMVLIALPPMLCIAGIMLANNICDIEDDLPNKRYTLPILIGKKKALFVYDMLYFVSYVDILVCVMLGYLPVIALITLVFGIKVFKNQRAFHELQTKKDTFGLSVMNLALTVFPLILSLFVAAALNLLRR
jgi:1,4-dihydroxy-2-naphthoate octaprenyltransferase